MDSLDQLTGSDIAQRLRNAVPHHHEPSFITTSHYREAAVLVPFIRVDQAWHILFIRRAQCSGDRHSGQVAFAGGKRESSDENAIATALREAHEEIGVLPHDVCLWGALNQHYSYVSHFRITPIVGTLAWPYPVKPDPREVQRIFSIPLAWLSDKANYEIQARDLNGISVPVVYFKEYEGELLWGATARMVVSLLDILTQA
ncbi:NUDIX hydrolase [Thiolinea disciformis]|uniref:NUDIX hydrolase n=1 Tax=Thiolinea disciformis TaxID=125614 RepID=UPI00036926A2|nr:CoA pyrophosphatase [Thiolinea disciformis]